MYRAFLAVTGCAALMFFGLLWIGAIGLRVDLETYVIRELVFEGPTGGFPPRNATSEGADELLAPRYRITSRLSVECPEGMFQECPVRIKMIEPPQISPLWPEEEFGPLSDICRVPRSIYIDLDLSSEFLASRTASPNYGYSLLELPGLFCAITPRHCAGRGDFPPYPELHWTSTSIDEVEVDRGYTGGVTAPRGDLCPYYGQANCVVEIPFSYRVSTRSLEGQTSSSRVSTTLAFTCGQDDSWYGYLCNPFSRDCDLQHAAEWEGTVLPGESVVTVRATLVSEGVRSAVLVMGRLGLFLPVAEKRLISSQRQAYSLAVLFVGVAILLELIRSYVAGQR